ncbi:hypothetical protein LINPERHAP2_LOCUS25075 [Linum perenne]
MRERMTPFVRLFAYPALRSKESGVSGRSRLSSAHWVSPSHMRFCHERFNRYGLGKDV